MRFQEMSEERGIINNSSLFGSEASKVIRNVIKKNNAVGTIIGYYDEILSIISVSDYLLSNLGYTEEEFVDFTKNSLINLFYGENKHFLEPDRFPHISGRGEGEMLTKDGTPVTVRMYKEDSKDISGRPVWILSVRLDWDYENVTLINGAIKSGLWYFDCDENNEISEVHYSHAFRRILGYKDIYDFPNELSSWSELLHPDDKEKTLERLMLAIADKTNTIKYNVEYRLLMRDGSYQWFRANAEIARRLDGTVRRITGIFVNIDEEKNAELIKRRADAFHKSFRRTNLFEYYADLKENSFDLIRVDSSLAKIFEDNATWEELTADFVKNYVCEEYRAEVRYFYDRAYIDRKLKETDGELSFECCILLNGERRWVRNVILSGETKTDDNVYIFLRDITAAKREAEQRRKMLAESR